MVNSISNAVAFVSGLENSTSLLPLALKDAVSTAGRTGMAYTQTSEKSRVHEARERLIEEAGTGIIWLGSIPLLRKILDKPINKIFNPNKDKFELNSTISLKKILDTGGEQHIEDQSLIQRSLKNAKDSLNDINISQTADSLRKAYKRAHLTKTAVSTIVPFYVLAVILPKFNQGLTKKLVSQDQTFNNKPEHKTKDNLAKDTKLNSQNLTFEKFINKENNSQNPSFKGLDSLLTATKDAFNPIKIAQGAQIDPANNMLLLDYGISGNRVRVARNKQERIETIIKEGGIIFFLYQGSEVIKKGLERACKKAGKLINLDYITLNSKNFAENLSNALKDEKSAEKFYQISANSNETSEKAVLDYIDHAIKTDYQVESGQFKNHATLQAAKDLGFFGDKTGILNNQETEEVRSLFKAIKEGKKSIRDGNKFIDVDGLKKLSENMKAFVENIPKNVADKSKVAQETIKSTKNYKLGMILTNLAICNIALAYALPKLQYYIREKVWGTKEFPGIKTS